MMLLHQMVKLADRGLLRHRLSTQINARKPTQGDRIIQGFFGGRVREVEPVLDKVDAPHALNPDGVASSPLRLGIEWLDGIAPFFPGNDGLHDFQKSFPACFLAVMIESVIRKRSLVHNIHIVITMIRIINRQVNYSEVPYEKVVR